MRVYINGQAQTLAAGATVAGLAEILGWEASKVAIEVNRRIVPRSQYGETGLSEDDRIEIVRFIGGG